MVERSKDWVQDFIYCCYFKTLECREGCNFTGAFHFPITANHINTLLNYQDKTNLFSNPVKLLHFRTGTK